MTNFEAWHFYLKDCTAPESYITMGFYGMISAALQRRVYMGSDERPLFPNQYIILCGPPATGKGNVIIPVTNFLRHHKLKKFKAPTRAEFEKMPTEDQAQSLASLQAEMDVTNSKPVNGAFRKLNAIEDPLLFPIAAQASTYEAMVSSHAKAIRSIYPSDKTSKLLKNGLYTHSSICFLLEELATVFRKHADDVVNYLIVAWDCNDYKKETKTQGVDNLKNPCTSIIAGTNPSFMHTSFNERLISEGYASRCFFVCEEKPRKYNSLFGASNFSEEQLQAKEQILGHLEKLSTIFGLLEAEPEAIEFYHNYVTEDLGRKELRVNPSPKLDYYYGRKPTHLAKLWMAVHFSESTDKRLTLAELKVAMQQQDSVERNMDKVLGFGGRNALAGVQTRVVSHLKKSGPLTSAEIWQEFVEDVNANELTEVLDFLITTGKIRQLKDRYLAI